MTLVERMYGLRGYEVTYEIPCIPYVFAKLCLFNLLQYTNISARRDAKVVKEEKKGHRHLIFVLFFLYHILVITYLT